MQHGRYLPPPINTAEVFTVKDNFSPVGFYVLFCFFRSVVLIKNVNKKLFAKKIMITKKVKHSLKAVKVKLKRNVRPVGTTYSL